MPQQQLPLPDRGGPIVGLRITVHDLVFDLDDRVTLQVEVRRQDGDWTSKGHASLPGTGRDVLSSVMDDVTYSWLYDHEGAVLRSLQAGERLARRHHKKYGR